MPLNSPGVRYEKATIGDIILSVILPGWGVLIGLLALLKGERVRALTMIGIGAGLIALIALAASRG